jgi:hypothetical protein
MSIRSRLETQLQNWLKQWNHLHAQGTVEWKKDRMKKIGGSEFYDLIKGKIAPLIKAKLGYRPQLYVISAIQGNVFEPLLRIISSIILDTYIYEAPGSIPSAEVSRKTYSMDGIGVVYHKDIKKHLITLFEFKCVYSRPIIQGECPESYQPQVLSGMSDLVIPERAVFIESMFRVCAFSDLNFDTKYINMIYRSKLPDNIRKPLMFGYMGLYIPKSENGSFPQPDLPEHELNFYYRLMQQNSKTMVDWGEESNSGNFFMIMKFIKNDIIKVRYSPINATRGSEWNRIKWFQSHDKPNLEKSKLDTNDFSDWTRENKHFCIGVMGWKIFDMNIMTVEKHIGYTKQYEKIITDFTRVLDELYSIEDQMERYNKYVEMFEMNEDGSPKKTRAIKKEELFNADTLDAVNSLFEDLSLS